MELTLIIEALLFSANGALSDKAMAEAIRLVVKESGDETINELAEVSPEQVHEAVEILLTTYRDQGRAFTLTERASGWRLCALPEFADWSRALFPSSKPSRLSPPALETLAIIAYRQPVTKGSMESVRGVSVDGVLQTLMDRNLVRIAGRADLPGRPLLYETTDLFFEHFGIRSVDDLPNSAELRQVALPEADKAETKDHPNEVQLHMVAIDDASLTSPRNKDDFPDAGNTPMKSRQESDR